MSHAAPSSYENIGIENRKLGMWLFLSSEVMFFTGLIGAYIVIREATGQWPVAPSDVVAPNPGFVSIPDVDGAPVVAPAPEDFALDADSPAIDAALPEKAPATDFFDAPRGPMPDQGAVERL